MFSVNEEKKENNQIDIGEVDAKAVLEKFDRESSVRQFTGKRKIIVRYLLIGYSIFALWTNVVVTLPEQIKRASFIAIAIFIAFILFPARRKYTQMVDHIHWYDLLLGSVERLPSSIMLSIFTRLQPGPACTRPSRSSLASWES